MEDSWRWLILSRWILLTFRFWIYWRYSVAEETYVSQFVSRETFLEPTLRLVSDF